MLRVHQNAGFFWLNYKIFPGYTPGPPKREGDTFPAPSPHAFGADGGASRPGSVVSKSAMVLWSCLPISSEQIDAPGFV